MRTFAVLVVLCLAGAYGQKGQSQVDVGGSGGGGGVGGMSGGMTGMSGGGSISGGSISGGAGGSTQGGMDLFTLLTRQIILAYGMDPLRLPDMNLPFKGILGKSGNVHTYHSLVFGLSHGKRTGPCFVTVDENGMRLGLDLGINNVIANSSATITFSSKRLGKTKVQVMSTVKTARAVILVSQTGPHEIHVKNFKMVKLVGFKLYIRPQGKVSPLVRPFLGAARKFLEMAVHRRLEKLVRQAVDTQIKKVLFFLQRQASARPQPQLPNFPTDSAIGPESGGGASGGAEGGMTQQTAGVKAAK